jgi:hypothetical protein
MPDEYVYRSRGENARRLGAFADQLGQRLINMEQAISQARRARDVVNYLRSVDQEYTDAITKDPSPENIFRSAAIARSKAMQLGPDPMVLNFVNAKDEEMRFARAAAMQPKDRLIGYEDIQTPKGGLRRIAKFGKDENNITRLQELNLGDPGADTESLALRYRMGRDLQNDLDEAQKEVQKLGRTYERGNLAIAALQRKDATDKEAIAEALSIMPELGASAKSRRGLLKQLIESQKNIESELPYWKKKLGEQVQPGWYTQNEDKVLRDNEIILQTRVWEQAKSKLDALRGKSLGEIRDALGVDSKEEAQAELERIKKIQEDADRKIKMLKSLESPTNAQPKQSDTQGVAKNGRKKYASREEFIEAFKLKFNRPPNEVELKKAEQLGRF